MRALTIHQPWADAIVYGGKWAENRTYPLPSKYAGSRILIHAGQTYDPTARYLLDLSGLSWTDWPDERGAIIGVATITGSHPEQRHCCAPWGAIGAHHWDTSLVDELPDPVPARGQRRLWTPPPDVMAAVADQITCGTPCPEHSHRCNRRMQHLGPCHPITRRSAPGPACQWLDGSVIR